MIITEPWGGLCNRIRVMKSAINLAEKIKQPLKVYWVVNSDLNSRFEQLFETCDLFELVNVGSDYDPRMILGKKTATHYISQDELTAYNTSHTDAKMETMTELFAAAGDNNDWLGFNRLLDSNIRKTSK